MSRVDHAILPFACFICHQLLPDLSALAVFSCQCTYKYVMTVADWQLARTTVLVGSAGCGRKWLGPMPRTAAPSPHSQVPTGAHCPALDDHDQKGEVKTRWTADLQERRSPFSPHTRTRRIAGCPRRVRWLRRRCHAQVCALALKIRLGSGMGLELWMTPALHTAARLASSLR